MPNFEGKREFPGKLLFPAGHGKIDKIQGSQLHILIMEGTIFFAGQLFFFFYFLFFFLLFHRRVFWI